MRCPSSGWGKFPGSGGSARLQKIVGITRTKDIVMRSRRIPARQAYDWGIATECVPDAELDAATDALVEELRGFLAAGAAHREKAAQRHRGRHALDRRSSSKAIVTAACASSDDFREGVEAFHAKRKPVFRGR